MIVARVKKIQRKITEKLRPLARAYIGGAFPDQEYQQPIKLPELQLESEI
jgi:hypothetical protein